MKEGNRDAGIERDEGKEERRRGLNCATGNTGRKRERRRRNSEG